MATENTLPPGPLPICMQPVQIHPNPTVWRDDESAVDWISQIVARHRQAESE